MGPAPCGRHGVVGFGCSAYRRPDRGFGGSAGRLLGAHHAEVSGGHEYPAEAAVPAVNAEINQQDVINDGISQQLTDAADGRTRLLAQRQRTAILTGPDSENLFMTISIYDMSIGSMSRMLNNLDNIVSKAESYAEANDIEPATLLQARLYPNMRGFIFQIQAVTDVAKGCVSRLSGTEAPKWKDDEKTFADVHARIKKALDFFAKFKPEQFDGSENREIELKLPGVTMNFKGKTYLLGFVLPNFYFHMTTAYNLLRHNGLDIGKRDFLGG